MSIKDLFKSGESFKFSSPKSTDKVAREVGESSKFIEQHEKDAPLLDLSESEFPWELQVFANQFLRECAQSSRQLTHFCQGLRKKLEDSEFDQEFWKILDEAYQHHFYVTDSKKHYLV